MGVLMQFPRGIRVRTRPRRQAALSALGLALAVGLAGCSYVPKLSSPSATIYTPRPAKFPDAGNLRKIVVVPFTGKGGAFVAGEWAKHLSDISAGPRPLYRVESLVPEDIKPPIGPDNGQPQGAIAASTDVASAVHLGKSLAMDGVYMGIVTAFKTDRQPFQKEVRTCARRDTSQSFMACLEETIESVECRKVTVQIDVSPRLIQVETGQSVYTQSKSVTGSDTVCVGDKAWADDGQMLRVVSDAINKLTTEMGQDVVPLVAEIRMPIKDEAPRLTGRSQRQFERAAEFGGDGNLERACNIWAQLDARGEADANLHYNLALCNEREGAIKQALERIRQAKELAGPAGRDDDDFEEAEKRYRTLLLRYNSL